MREKVRRYSWGKRLLAMALAVVMMVGYFPTVADAASAPGTVETVADPSTLTRPELIYGRNTQNAGKITVGKSVSDTTVTLPTGEVFTPADNNFIITVSQTSQVMGLATESAVPVDVVFVLDTSGSMGHNNQEHKTGRAEALVEAANSAIATLLAANEYNRVSVVAFSSADYGGGSSDGNAANVLSPLHHYEGTAATKHLQWVNNSNNAFTGDTSNGSTRTGSTGQGNDRRSTYNFGVGSEYYLIAGRNTSGGINNTRNGGNGGTNIHAGIALGAQQLTAVTDTTVTYEDGTTVTRMPFIVLLSDGAPTFSSSTQNWHTPSQTQEQGPGSRSYAGNGFLAALTAAYYKGAVTEHYYGNNADNNNRCNIYTIGVQLESQSNDADVDLAQMTMDPKEYLSDSTNTFADEFTSYWNSYKAGNQSFNILVSYEQEWRNVGSNRNPQYAWVDTEPVYYTVNRNTFAATSNYVNGKNSSGTSMYSGGIAYNDGYYNATQTSEIAGIFTDIVNEIQKKAISSPTHVGTHGADFSGYVTFTDPLGEYMELKDMKGIVANGNFYQGASAARHMSAFGKTGNANNDPEFDALLKAVLQKRLSMTSSQATDAFINQFASAVMASANQAYWNSNSDYDNSIVWWGNSYPTGEEDESVQILGFADNDSIEYIEEQRAANSIPTDADYVCRSYFYYGTAGGTVQNPDHEYLYFVVRVQRELTAPYKQTVVISAPASLLSVEEVFITEETDNDGDKVYTAEVTPAAPLRVVYEVGLRSDINAQNVDTIISADYKNEKPLDSESSVNYDPATGTYYFFTNDWNRSESLDSHHRAQAKATFDAAVDNPFYTYQHNTTITDASGVPYTGDTKPSGVWYYVREYYDWSQATYDSATRIYSGVAKKNAIIRIDLPTDSGIDRAADGSWYIDKGVYASSTLVVNGDDVPKGEGNNLTGTAATVAHPHRTGSATNSHYTVLLGNNGRISVVSDPPKSVSINNSNTNDNGKTVMVGDILTYTIKVVNNEGATANAVVTDQVPDGTQFISAENGGDLGTDGKTVTWNLTNIPAGGSVNVSFKVQVLPSAISGPNSVVTVDNEATIKVGNNPAYVTNKTSNPPEGKKVTDTAGNEFASNTAVKVGDVLVYRVRAYNDTGAKANITITDNIPAGTTYVPGSADHNGQLSADGKTLTWNIQGVDANASVVVSFRVEVDASAKQSIANQASIKIGDRNPNTNLVTTPVGVGNISIKKDVASGSTDEEFSLILNEAQGKLNGTYTMTGGKENSVTFTNGVSTSQVTIKNGQTVTIQGLPLGAGINVAEAANAGWTPTYRVGTSTEPVTVAFVNISANTPLVTITNNYYAQPAHFQLKGFKNFVGSSFPAGTFSFNAVEVDENGSPISNATPLTATVTKTVVGGQTKVEIAFAEVSFNSAFVARYFEISEAPSTIPGVISDRSKYTVKLSVADNGDGQLVAHAKLKKSTDATSWDQVPEIGAEGSTNLEFTNYYPEETTATINGTKTLNNRYIQDKEFSFELVEKITVVENGVSVDKYVVVDTVLLAADGDSSTEEFSFTRKYTAADMGGATEKTFNYTVREVQGADSAISYSSATFDVAVKVTMNAQGKLEAVVDYDTATDGAQTTSNVAFTNTFTPSGTTLNLTGQKTLSVKTGVEGDRTLDAGEFSFSIYQADSSFQITDHNEIAGGSNGAGDTNNVGVINFGSIGYTLADMTNPSTETVDGVEYAYQYFYYVIKEDVPAENAPTFNPNMVYDRTEYHVTVKVTYNKTNGAMAASVYSNAIGNSSDSFSGYNFTNTQNPAYVTFAPVVNKTTSVPAGSTDTLHSGLSFSFKVNSAVVENNKLVSIGDKVEATGISAATTGGAAFERTGVNFTQLRVNYADWANADTDHDGKVEYWYAIRESNTSDTGVVNNGVTYDKATYLMKVVIVHTNHLLQVDPAQTKYYQVNSDKTLTEMSVEFKNTYDAKTHINLSADKILTGRDLEKKEFDFRLQPLTVSNGQYAVDTSRAVDGQNTSGANSGVKAPVQFASLNYSTGMVGDDSVGTHIAKFYYLMSEIKPETAALAGVTYDPNAYIVEITVKKTNTASSVTMSAELTDVFKAELVSDGVYQKDADDNTVFSFTADGKTGVVFNNSYTPTGTSVKIVATKELTGRALKANEFTFELYRVGVDDQNNPKEFLAGSVTNTDAASGNVVFTRQYNASNLSSQGFTEDSNNDGNKEYTVTYHMVERAPTQGGVTKVSGEYWIKVTIEQNLDNATYKVIDTKYYSNAACLNEHEITDLTQVKFVNKYTTNDAHYTPVAVKQFKQKDANGNWTDKTMADHQFTFSVIELDANGNEKNGGAAVAAGVSKADGTVEFGRLTYSHNAIGGDHAHYYKIVEDQGNEPGVTYDTKAYYLKVTINDDGHGNLSVVMAEYFDDLDDMKTGANAVYAQAFTTTAGVTSMTETSGKSNVAFVNRFGPGYVTIQPGDLKKIVKVEQNPDVIYALNGGEFDFDLYAYTGDDWKDDNWRPTGDPITSGSNGPSNDQGVANLYFGSITYTSEAVRNDGVANGDGTYTATYNYIVVERSLMDENIKGVTHDSKRIKLTVKVTDDGYGNLTVQPAGVEDSDGVADNDLTFTNTYKAENPVKVTFTADKTLVNKKLTDGEFRFLLEWVENGVDKSDYLYNDASGKITYTKTFTAPGEYTFTLSEEDKNSANYNCDSSVYTIKVNVTDDLAGKLHATTTYYKNYDPADGVVNTPIAGIDFVNTYIASPIEVDLSAAIGATKTVLDPDGNEMQGKVEGFDFELIDATGAVITTGTSDATGRIFFAEKVKFNTAGEYHFRIRETANADKPGYTMDTQEWRVYVLVRYYDGNGTAPAGVAPGSLYVVESEVQTFPVSELSAQSEMAPEFVNIYNPEPLHLTLKATKKLTGRDLLDGEFTFHLVEKVGENTILRGEAKNQADGTIAFAMTYTLPGTYTYELHEHVPEALEKLEGVTYDERVHAVTVTVKDQNGKLVVDGTTSTWDTGVTFENTYKPGPTTATINAHKVLEGKPLKADEFSFELLNSEKKVIDTVKNDGAGNVVFTVEVPAADEYHYYIREVKGTDTHVTYDCEVEYKVTVKVSQNAAGKLVTEVTYDTADGKMPVFKNTYKPDPTTITLEGAKKLTGRDMVAGEFKFEVRDGANTLVATGTNDAQGNIVFSAVKLPVVGTYKLTVTEVKGSAEGMSYDNSAFAVTVTVVNEDGVLVATAEYPEGGIVFTNAYEKVEETTVPETTVPETTVPETTAPEKPKDPNVPDTGDRAQLGLWIAVLAGSVLLLIITFVVVIIPRKKGAFEK